MKRSTITGRPIPTYQETATTYSYWEEYMDTHGLMSEEEFDAVPVAEKIAQIVDCFGPEDDEQED